MSGDQAKKKKKTFKDVKISSDLTEEELNSVNALVGEFSDVFSDIPERTKAIEHKIILTSETQIRVKPYPIPLHFRQQVDDEIKELLNLGIIQESESEYCSPLVLVRKRDQSIRLCVDYRRLNAITKPDIIPMQDPEVLLSQIAESKIFTKIDLTKGYYQLEMNKESRQYTAFQSHDNTYDFSSSIFFHLV